MDRLIKPEVQEINLTFLRGQNCSQAFNLTNLMHTMPVAVSLTSTDPSVFSLHPSLSSIPPLSSASFTLSLTKPFDHPPLSSPPAAVLVRSSMLPTRKASHDHLLRIFSKPGPHIFKDASIPVSLVGLSVAHFLLSPSSHTDHFQLSKAISVCDEPQLTSLLRSAVANGKSHSISALIEAGAGVGRRDGEEESLMCLAIKSQRIESLQILVESGCAVDPAADLLLHVAAAANRVDMMEVVCLSYVDLDLNAVDRRGRTALHIAALNGQVEAIQFLLSVGGDADAADHEGWTALHLAAEAEGGRLDAVEHLLGQGVFGKYAVNREGKTAFGVAVEQGNSHLYDALHLGDLLHRAARLDDVHAMKSCLAQGAKVNGVDQNGWSALHRAAFKGHLESARLLVGHGARVDCADGSGYTPLLRAVEAGHVEVAMYLLARGAKASLKSLGGMVNKFDFEGFKTHRESFALERESQRERGVQSS